MPAEEAPDAGGEVGVVDRVLGDIAVVLVGDDQAEHHLDVARLPQGAAEGSWLRVRRGDEGLVVLALDAQAETNQRSAMHRRLDGLRHRSRRRFG